MRAMYIVLALALSLALAPTARAQSPLAPVGGVILDNRTGVGAPGLTASLIHPLVGRSTATLTDADGHFSWAAIPRAVRAVLPRDLLGQQLDLSAGGPCPRTSPASAAATLIHTALHRAAAEARPGVVLKEEQCTEHLKRS